MGCENEMSPQITRMTQIFEKRNWGYVVILTQPHVVLSV